MDTTIHLTPGDEYQIKLDIYDENNIFLKPQPVVTIKQLDIDKPRAVEVCINGRTVWTRTVFISFENPDDDRRGVDRGSETYW